MPPCAARRRTDDAADAHPRGFRRTTYPHGSGPGVASCLLAQRFGTANVVAVDGSAAMLEHATARAARLGLAPRIETRLVAFPDGLATLGEADVVWASLVLHHLGDEASALRQIRALLAPGGLLALVERAGPMRVVLEDAALGPPDIWERLEAAWTQWFTDMRAALPDTTTSADYPEMLAAAGFEVVEDEVLTVDLPAPLDAQPRRLAQRHLERTRAQLAQHAGAADLDALDALLGEHGGEGVLRRDDMGLHASRHLYRARSPTEP